MEYLDFRKIDPEDMDYIQKYVWLLDNMTDASREFKEASALYLISTFAGRKFPVIKRSATKLFSEQGYVSSMFLNVWFMLIGESRLGRKSTVIDFAEQFIDSINPNLKIPITFTPQSAISVLSQMSVGHETHATWINDEVSGFFSIKEASYMVLTDSLLCRIYDGRDYQYSTMDRGIETVTNPYLTALTASTPIIVKSFSPHQLMGGFLARFGFVYDIKVKRSADISKEGSEPPPEVFTVAQDIREFLHAIYTHDVPRVMVMSRQAADAYSNFCDFVDNQIISLEPDDFRKGFLGHLPVNVHKYACLYRLARFSADSIMTYTRPVIEVQLQDMQNAIRLGSRLWNLFNRMFVVARSPMSGFNVRSDEAIIEHVYQKILEAYAENGDEPVSMREIAGKVRKIQYDKVRKTIETLVAQGRLTVIQDEYKDSIGRNRSRLL